MKNTLQYDFLILGASGMQGRIVARDLLENGFSTFLADIQKGGSEGNLTRFPKTAFATVDLRTIENIIEVIKKTTTPIPLNFS